MKTKLTRRFSMLAASLLLGIYLPAQLTVNSSQTPAQLAQLLSGTGVQILNPQIHGGTNSYGKYNATSSNLNINEGVILTTGLATNAIGPNNTSSMTSYFGNPNVPSTYPLLTNYTGRIIYEYCELEFDIIPQGDTISFPFVFGSEEYEEWVCSQFNDVFGFFISGPGIIPDPGAGIYKNLAKLPNTNIPVTINSVNQNSNTQYYQNNNNGSSVQYDGFTTGLVAVSAVIPCQVYHIKLIVADASDKLWDSGVFIEKISSNSVILSSSTLGGTPFMIEGCNPGTVTFTRPNITNLPLAVTYWIGGTATNGTDYPLIGTSANVSVAKHITIPANQASASININVYADNIPDNNEYLTIYLGNPLCPSVLDSLRFYIHDYLNASVTPTSANVCVGTGTQLTASGDASAFVWTPSTGLNNANIPNPVATPSVTTTYTVSSTVGTCHSNLPVTINVSNISLAFTTTNINCSNSATGAASVTATGGFPPYTYAWSGPNGFSASTASISNLAAGTYTVVVTGLQTCTATGTVTITTSPGLTVSASGNIFSCGYNVTCFGGHNGAATATVSGGTAPYTYSWNTSPVQTTATATGLFAGVHTVTVTDANGCTASATVLMTQPPLLTATISSSTNILCSANATGSATVVGGGGVPPYTYSWNTTPIQTSATATNLAAGTYIVTVRDANWCTSTASVTITQSGSLTASIGAQTNVSCFGNTNGSATVSVSGGTAPFVYSWNTTPIQTSATAINLGAGTYVVTVTDVNGCTGTATATITAPSVALTAVIATQTNASCFGGNGSATISVTGGTAPYTISWGTVPVQTGPTATNLPAGTYAVTVTDANGCQTGVAVCITQPASAVNATITAQTNVLCYAHATGSATVSASGGTAPYTYSWNTSPVQTSATATNLSAGIHVVTVTDANGCSATASVNITQPAAVMVASITAQINVTCFGGNNGSATVMVTGGTMPYTYSWNTTPVQTSAIATNLAAGSYVVTVTDANGCSVVRTVVISQPASAISASISAQTNVSCFGGNHGSATVSVSGGTAPYVYSWNTSPVQTSATANNLAAGSYVVTITDANGCSATASVTISQPASAISASISAQTNVSCFGNTNGSATVSVIGGTAPYVYSWNTSPIQTSATASNLVAGTYVVTITDANGCSATASVIITQPASAMLAGVCAQVNVSCFGGNDGSAMAIVSGGTAPYTYSWSTVPVQTGVTATNLSAGTYTVIITDANGCTASQTVTITQPASAMSVSISAQTNVSCFGNTNGSATVLVSGGTAPYTYSWNTSPLQTSATANNLAAGTYVVTVTDANGCSTTASVTISQPASTLSASISAQTNVSCFGGNHGSATVVVSGGTAPYSYSWNTSPVQTSATASNLVAGTYVVTITDANGCSTTASVTISQPASTLSASISAQTNISCFGNTDGSATVSVSGGTAPYTYGWSTSPVQVSATASNLAAGNYSVLVTDANGCSVTVGVSIFQPASSLTATISSSFNVSCFGGNTGSATVMAGGGTAPYSYSWNTSPVQTSATASNLAAGTYVVTITDANGCSASASVTISQPATAMYTAICLPVHVSCYGGSDGSVHAMIYGGTPPYTYVWSTVPVQTTATATNLSAGTYTVTATDANGCTISQTFTITQPASAINASISAQTNVSCFGNTDGSATVSVTGGTAPYTYSWNTSPVQTSATASNLGAGTHVVTITDANGCTATASVIITAPASAISASISAQTNVSCFGGNHGSATVSVSGGTAPYSYSWNTSPIQTSATASNLVAGTYVVTITDANGCSATASVTITQPASALSASISAQTNVSCFGGNQGSATVVVSGGTAPYSYSWNTSPVQTSASASNLVAGTYVVTITDANGCSATASVTITQPASALSASISAQTNVSCFGGNNGSATVSVSGGTAPYSYSWNTSPVQTSATASNLVAGTYVVTITDANGCSATASVTISQPASTLIATISASAQTNVSCFGGNNGSATVSVSGGTAPYSYSWNTSPVQTSATASNLVAGTYVVTITDANGCSATASVTISQPASTLIATISASAQTNVSCFGGNNGSATVIVSGGTTPYSYSWNSSPVQTSATASNLVAGTYVVTITDANGCSTTASVTITQPASALSASISSQINVSCFGNSNGSASVAISGGTAPYSYSWNTSPVQTSATANNLAAGSYVVTITDANGCSTTASVTITQPASAISASITAQTNVSCFGGNNGSATVSGSGGTAPYSYNWNSTPVQTSATATNLVAGTYAVIVTDANGCSVTIQVSIVQPATALSASISAQTNVSCAGNNDGSATVAVSGGTAPYTYSWNTSPVQTSATASNLVAGTYVVTITDANGCSATASVTITQSTSSLSASAATSSYNGSNISCFGGQDGYINITVSGGTAPYVYAWTGPSSFTSSSQNISGLVAGTYSLTITDGMGCSITLTQQLTQPATAIAISSSVINSGCQANSGSIDLSVTGGTSTYTYAWSGPNSFSSSSEDITGLSAGVYVVTVTDANGCSATSSISITQTTAMLVNLQSSMYNGFNISCAGGNNGDIDLSVTGGNPAYTYSWTGPNGFTSSAQDITGLYAGTYFVTITDANGCTVQAQTTLTEPSRVTAIFTSMDANCVTPDGIIAMDINGGVGGYSSQWSNGSTQTIVSGLTPGAYIVTVTDANGCAMIDTAYVGSASYLATEYTVTSPSCNGSTEGAILLNVTNGTAPYTYAWSNGATTNSLTGLVSGMYIATTTDSNGCVVTDTIHVSDGALLSLTVTSELHSSGHNISVMNGSDGSIDLTVEGGNAPYTFVWSTGATTEDIDGLSAGTYTVTVTDASGCSAVAFITLTEPLDLAMPNGFSPNADGSNDYFVVQGLGNFPNNHIEIYNRWGNLVYETDHYKNDWTGISDKGQMLPDATYFVILEVNGGDIKLNSYVDLRR